MSKEHFDKESLASWLACGGCISLGGQRVLLAWGDRTWSPTAEPHTRSFYAPSFFLEDATPWFHQEHYTVVSTDELLALLSGYHQTSLQKPQWEPLDSTPFTHAFAGLQDLFAEKKLEKAVAYAVQKGKLLFDAPHRSASLHSILENQKKFDTHIYGFWDCSAGMLGSTPEILFGSSKKNVIHTMACAGTQDRRQPHKLLENDPKSSLEHQCVVDGIKEALSPYGSVQVGPRTILELPRLRHLVTPMELQMGGDVSFETLVKVLHPTPALGAFPKEFGKAWLREYDKLLPRRRFGAPFGCVDSEMNVSICYVAIRNVQWTGNDLSIFAGCGIVPTSSLQAELQELQLKIQATKESLKMGVTS